MTKHGIPSFLIGYARASDDLRLLIKQLKLKRMGNGE